MKNLFLLFFLIFAFTTTAQDTKGTYFLSGEVGLINILISEHPLYNSENLGSAAKLSNTLRTGLRYGCTEKLGFNFGLEFGLTRYGENHSRRLVGGNQLNPIIVSTAQSSSIRSFNIGVPLFLDIQLGSKVALLAGAKYQHNFSGKINTEITTPNGPSKREQDFSVTKNNVSGTIGFRFYPKGTENISKNIFFGLSGEYFFIADEIFFTFNEVNRYAVNFNVGYHF